MKEPIETARLLRDEATRDRKAGDLDEAARRIGEAAALLDRLWQQQGAAIDEAGANASPDDKDLVEELAETYGVMGGIQRSRGDFGRAIAAYDRGARFEQHAARRVGNSYNLIQRLLNRVLLEPALAGGRAWTVLDVDMGEALRQAESVLVEQLGTTRRRDPWAAADLVLIRALLAPLQGEATRIEAVDRACEALDALKPDPFVYESTLRTFRDAHRTLHEVAAGRAEVAVLVAVLSQAIDRLDAGFARARRRQAGA